METETRAIHTFKEGDLFDNRYRLVKRAGSGGFADVWKAEDTLRKNKVVALKIYTRLDEEGIKAMSEEYNETEDIQNPNLLTGNHFAAVGNIPYMEMRYCDGGSLASRVGNMSNDELRHMLRDVCTGLSYLHAEGMVHQDIKPENILLDTKHNRYMLADFGISGKSRSRLSKSAKMASDLVAMTAAYAPPEKLSANRIDREPSTRGDIFSLGVTLYELATGNLPVDLPQSTGQLLLISQGRQPLYFDNIADPQLKWITECCMCYRKEDRPTADEVLAMLDGRRTEPQFKHESTGNTNNTGGTGNAGNGKRPTERIKVNAEEPRPLRHTPADPPNFGAHDVPHSPKSNLKYKWIFITAILAVVLLGVCLIPKIPEKKRQITANVHMDGNNVVFFVNGTEYCYKMVPVDGGTYLMGFTENRECFDEFHQDCFKSEKPAHSVTVNDFYIGQTEVTQALWKAVMGNLPSRSNRQYNLAEEMIPYWENENLPVESVSYYDIKDFIEKLNALTGKSFRMPTEEEWEFAARGGENSLGYKFSGGNDIGSIAWYEGNSGGKTHPVGQKQANELGLYDMSGNVMEICSSQWRSDYNSSYWDNERTLRGGSWNHDPDDCRVSERQSIYPTNRYFTAGFRLAL